MTKEEAVNKAVSTFAAEIGYHEKATNAQLDDKTANSGSNNWNKYARDLDAIGYYNGRKNIGAQGQWCDISYDWVFNEAFGFPTGRDMLYQPPKSTGAGTYYSAQFYKKNGAWYTKPERGDQIFFWTKSKEICHTGMVSKVTGSYVYTIEGNADNQVQEKKYALNNSSIAGYGRPKWSLVADIPAEPAPEPVEPTEPKGEVINVETKELSKGSKGQAVKSMQLLLIGNGYSCGDAGADGDFGDATKGAVMAFQKRNRLTQDGICGVKTWTKLING